VPIIIRPEALQVAFFESARQAFFYPFRGNGLILIFGGTLFFGFLDAANFISRMAFMFGLRGMAMRAVLFTFILATGYLFSYLKSVIASSADGDPTPPDWPELGEWKADIVIPMSQLVSLALASFGLALGLQIWSDGDYPCLVIGAMLAGCVYFPMAFLGIAIFDSLAALNPIFVAGSILRVPREYSVAAAVFTGIVAMRWLSELALDKLLHLPLFPSLIADILTIYFLVVEARILGVLYRARKGVLGWFKQSATKSR
jgi:hypothetical protein